VTGVQTCALPIFGVAAFQDFSLGVPSEKDASTVSVKLMLPPGLNFVSPVVKPGWTIQVKQGPIPPGMTPPVAMDGDVATSIPSEIDWTGGNIPAGQKDIFVFSAQVPAQAGELDWKAYQTYSDGSTVSWDLGPKDPQPKDDKGNPDFSSKGPYSTTMVMNDLKGSTPAANTGMMASNNTGSTSDLANKIADLASKVNWLTLVSGGGLILSVIAIFMQMARKK